MATFTNQATLTYSGNTVVSNTVSGELTDAITVTKSAVAQTYGADAPVTYVLSLVNNGEAAFTGLTVTDNLGAYSFGGGTVTPLDYVEGTVRYYLSGSLQPAPTAVAGPPLVISGISVPAGGNAVLIYQARTNSYAPPGAGGSITNTATVSGGGLCASIEASQTITAENTALLTINKSVCPAAAVRCGGRLTYTFVIRNTGNKAVTAEDLAAVTDVFDPVLRELAVTFNAEDWVSPVNYTYNSVTGLFTTVAGRITVPAATFVQEASGAWTVQPGESVLTVSGTV